MTTGKDTASFFENGSTEQFEFCLKLYPQVLKLKAETKNKKPQELIRLDEWYQNELPKLIKARGKDAHMVYDELVQTMKWKQARGKFYPQLSYLIKVNTPRAVLQETKKAFRKLPNLEQALAALINLKGVGTTMASALLAAASPDKAPFMADECLMAIPEIEGIDYTAKEYLNFVQHIQTTVDRLNLQAGGETPFWSPHTVELALWSHYVANDLSPELLDEMPSARSGAGGGISTNGSSGNNNQDALDADDTNDADEESLGAVGRSGALESETDNENTNPAHSIKLNDTTDAAATLLQDGDSNFVSNDSTSQEPIIDENTTQTTATTSTDDGGDIGTPLASDSESNIEAPQSAKLQVLTTAAGGASETAAGLQANGKKATSELAAKSEAATVTSNANGNGALATTADSSLDGENSTSCLRSISTHDEASGEYDEEESSSNSNSNNCIAVDKQDSTLTSLTTAASPAKTAGQKRVLHCGNDAIDDAQPDMKKIRSD